MLNIYIPQAVAMCFLLSSCGVGGGYGAAGGSGVVPANVSNLIISNPNPAPLTTGDNINYAVVLKNIGSDAVKNIKWSVEKKQQYRMQLLV